MRGGVLLERDVELGERLGSSEALRVAGAAADNKAAELVLVEVRLGAGDRIVEVGRGGTRDGDLEVLSELQGAVTRREAAGLGPESSDGRVDGREERNESEELHGGSDVRYEERKEWMA